MDIKRTFEKGVMNKDYDERLVPNGFYKHAENIITDSTDGSDVGVIKNILSNKQITNLNLGNNPKTLNGFSDETKQKIYYFIKSDSGTFLIEYDDSNQSASFLLHDTRLKKVLDLKEEYRITSIRKIYNDDSSKDLLVWTNNDMEICCINIERAKKYGENGFDKEDIYLIKKPPVHAPKVTLLQNSSESNEIEEKFVLFATRYKYLDGEYSAISPFSVYNFIPKPFEIDFETLQNKAMLNNFNAANIIFETGDKRVTDIQVVAKFSNSETIYIVETLNKQKENITHDSTSNIIYNNKKLYVVLPEKELYRTFDNVPRKAKALTLIGNRLVLGNYTEGYNITDNKDQKIKLSYDIDVISSDVNSEKKYKGVIGPGEFFQSKFQIKNSGIYSDASDSVGGIRPPLGTEILTPGSLVEDSSSIILNSNLIEFKKGSSIEFNVVIKNDNNIILFQKLYSLFLNDSFASFDIEKSNEIMTFIDQINNDIKNNFVDPSLPPGIIITNFPYITVSSTSSVANFYLNALMYEKDQSFTYVVYHFDALTSFKQKFIGIPTSLKSFTDYEVGIVYQDEFKRSTTVLASINNTKFIPFQNAYTQNKFKISVNHKPPKWAKYYRFAIKAKPLQYENIFVNRFYEENGFTWAKLEGDNKDKVKKNDMLLVKKTANADMKKPIRIKVLDIVDQPSDFIKGNKDIAGVDIVEEAGLYMKIKPTEFSMNLNDYDVRQTKLSKSVSGSGNFPSGYANLFSTTENTTTKLFAVPSGSVIQLNIKSSNNPDSGWKDNILNKTYYVADSFSSLGEWFKQNITSVNNLFGNEGNAQDNYSGKIQVVRGSVVPLPIGGEVFVPDPNGNEYLKVTGTKAGMTGGRSGYLDVSINIRTSDGFYVFETQPKKEVDLDIYYLSSETFEVKDGLHIGNQENQTISKPAVSILNFFNCYTFGNGIESYKIRDGFNENYLNIDYTPCTTTIEEYKETVRTSDITWGSVYNESSNINGLNEFNAATLNWKELDKQNGEIRLLHAREGNLLVIQEDKWGQVLFGKNAIYSADGNPTITTTNDVLRDYIPYAGTYGITDVESFVSVAQRCYAVDKKRGAVLRLSNDGINEITNGMNHWFKKSFQERNAANVIAGFDPFYKTYNITVDEQPEIITELKDSQKIIKYNLKEIFKIYYKLNGILNDIVVNYNITSGSVDLKAISYGQFNYYNLTGSGSLTIPNQLLHPDLIIQITPVGESASFDLDTKLPIGDLLTIENIVISSVSESGKMFSKGYSLNNGVVFRTDLELKPNGITERKTETGSQGIGIFPNNGDTINVSVFYDAISTKQFYPADGNKVKYIIKTGEFDLLNLKNSLDAATEIPISLAGKGSFIFDRDNIAKKLFIIYDLRTVEPFDISTTATINYSSQLIYFKDLFVSDYPLQGAIIKKYPTNGNALISALNSFVVSYSGTSPQNDTMYLEYEITVEGKVFKKSLTINVNL